MRKISKIVALLMVLCMAVGVFAGCNAGEGSSQTTSGGASGDTSGVDEIYFLNFKPEIAESTKQLLRNMKKKQALR